MHDHVPLSTWSSSCRFIGGVLDVTLFQQSLDLLSLVERVFVDDGHDGASNFLNRFSVGKFVVFGRLHGFVHFVQLTFVNRPHFVLDRVTFHREVVGLLQRVFVIRFCVFFVCLKTMNEELKGGRGECGKKIR